MEYRFVATLWIIFAFFTSIFLFIGAFIIRIATSFFDKKLKILHLYTCFWASLYSWIVPRLRVSILGKEKIKKDTAYIIVSNHQSHIDVLMIFRLFFHFKWVSKAEIFRVPFIGWNMFLNRYVKIIRGDKNSALKKMSDTEKHLAKGSSVYFFPEGTRSTDGTVKKFKHGAFSIAKKAKVPILPIVISGTSEVLPKHTLSFKSFTRIFIKVLDEIPYSKYKNLTVNDTAAMVREYIVKELNILQANQGEPA